MLRLQYIQGHYTLTIKIFKVKVEILVKKLLLAIFGRCDKIFRGDFVTEQELYEKWQHLTIRDNFIFSKVMEEYPNLCQELLENILHIKITRISYPEREKVLESRLDSKGIRLDVYVEDKSSNRSFDVEMQISNSDNLAKRMRYYQGLIDMDKLKHGEHYDALGDTFIIFVCTFDRFKDGRHIYTFKETCTENSAVKLGDGATKIFLNTKGKLDDVSPDVKVFLNYVESGIVAGKFVTALNDAVEEIKSMRKGMKEYMTYEMTLLENRMAGREEGRAEERENFVIKMLRKGTAIEDILELTELPLKRIKEIAAQNSIELKAN